MNCGLEQRVGVGAHGIERDVAEVEQAGKADDDVQPEREQDVEDRVVRDAHQVVPMRKREGSERERDETSAEPRQARGRLRVSK